LLPFSSRVVHLATTKPKLKRFRNRIVRSWCLERAKIFETCGEIIILKWQWLSRVQLGLVQAVAPAHKEAGDDCFRDEER
jgi:hypothetical protein